MNDSIRRELAANLRKAKNVCKNRTVVVRFLILRSQHDPAAGAWQIEREMMKINNTK
jgi:hypothetical protein